MMVVEKFNKSEHLGFIQDWLRTRQSFTPRAEEIPATGVIVYERGTPFAAGFLKMCEGGEIAIFDGLVTDPDAAPEQRNAGLDLLVAQLIETAKELKLKGIIAWSVDDRTLLRSYRHGFVKLPETVIALNLS